MEASALRHPGRAPALAGRSPLLRLQGDEKLIALIRRGHQGAFETLVHRYQARLLGFCRHMLGSTEDAEDVLQEVFASAYRAINADQRPINTRPWLYRIARNRCLNHLRRPVPSGQDSMDVFERDGGTSTADTVHKRQEFRDIVADVQELPESQRTALLLREMDALSYEQIAEAMDNTVPSVKSLLVRARVSLAEAGEARLLTCDEVRMQLGEVAEGLIKSTPPARRHVKDCDRCRRFKGELRKTNRALAAIYPVGPLIILQKLVLVKLGISAAAGGGSSAAGGGFGLGPGAAGLGLGGGVAGGGLGAGAGAGAAASIGAAAGGASLAAGGAAATGAGIAASSAGAAATGAGIAGAAGGGAAASGAIGAGVSALATKAAAGVVAAAIVTAGAVEAKHVSDQESRVKAPATKVAAERKQLEVPKAKPDAKAIPEATPVVAAEPPAVDGVAVDPTAPAATEAAPAPTGAADAATAAPTPPATSEPLNGGAKAPDAVAPTTAHGPTTSHPTATTSRPATPSAPAGEPATTPAQVQPAPTAGEQPPRRKRADGASSTSRTPAGSTRTESTGGAEAPASLPAGG